MGSAPLVVINTAKVFTKGMKPVLARPAAMDTMLSSLIPTLKYRSGNAFPNIPLFVDEATSASSPTILESCSPNSLNAAP